MRKAIITCGGWEGHEPALTTAIAKKLLEAEGFEAEIYTDLDIYTDEKAMGEASLIVPCWTGGSITGEQSMGLLKTIASGVGVAGWHGGMCDAFRADTNYQYMTGGQWVAHPGGIIKYVVNITSDDPIVAGIEDFEVESEQYYMHTDPSNEVLAYTTFQGQHDPWVKGCVMPVVWKRMWDRGRVFYMSLGHTANVFDIPAVPEILRRGMLWAAREEDAR
ncbi:MAG: ThuA domain-containing protein [Abditibacteriota bacterium]|nr:ThuA domain-containing protein [Abditibacteriota bacterium]